jgi:hypothetical protein
MTTTNETGYPPPPNGQGVPTPRREVVRDVTPVDQKIRSVTFGLIALTMTPAHLLLSSMVASFLVRCWSDRAYVSGLERGERNPAIITSWRTSKALGVKLQALTTERGTRQ